MKQITFSKPHNFFTSILLALTISISATILILSAILYVNFGNIALPLIHTFIEDNLSQVCYSATFINSSSKSLALQMNFDRDISKLLLSSSFDPGDSLVSMKKIDTFRNTSPFTHSIYIYNGKLKKFYTSMLENEVKDQSTFYDKDIVDILQHYQAYRRMMIIPRRIPDPYKKYHQDKYTNVYTVIFTESPQNKVLEEAIIINISENWLRDMIDSLSVNPGSDTFIIDTTGKTMISSQNYPILKDLSGENYIERILALKNSSGYFISDVYGTKSLITYASYSSMNWIFIRITPYSSIIDKINGMKYITVFSAFLILATGLFLSFLISRKLYKPIDSMVVKLNSLEEEKRENHYEHKQNFLLHILHGDMDLDFDKTFDRFKKFDIKLNPSAEFLILLLKIDQFSDFCNKYTLKDRNLFKFSIMNIASEICSEHFVNEPVEAGENLIALLLNASESNQLESSHVLYELIKSIQLSTSKYLEISLSITISTAGDTIKDVFQLYGECLQASLYRTFYGHRCIIYAEKIKNLKSDEYSYPMQKEKLLIEALLLGKTEEVKKIYSEIIIGASKHQYTVFQSAISHLARAINTAIDCMQKNSYSAMLYNFTTFIVEVSKLETLDEISAYFFKAFEDIIHEMDNKKSIRHNELIEIIVSKINKEYFNQNLSIETIADLVNMSPVYLGRLFKKLTSKSISDYISEIRMAKAENLLKETDLSINEILENTGFVSSGYFYTQFRKIHGITPNEYRQK